MDSYKGVELFGEIHDNASTSKFPQWQTKVRIALKRHFPASVKFISHSFAGLEDDLADRVSVAVDQEAAKTVRRDHEEAKKDAAEHLLLFLAEPLSSQVHVYKRASLVWSYLFFLRAA
jgi:hypothetical protein